LKQTNSQISIFELLKISLAHRQILDKALAEASVPQDLDLERFQSMVGHQTSPYLMTFSEEDNNSLNHPHNQPLHIEVMIHQTRVRRVFIDNGASLNIISTAFLRQLDYSEDSIDPQCKITIKAYDKVERKSLGLVILPIRVGLVEKNITFQVLDIPLAYNIMLGRPWIHEMRAMPSTYHQCVKFLFHGSEVTIPATTSYTCNMLKAAETLIPANHESTDYHNNKLKEIEQSFKLKEAGMGEYHVEPVLSLTSLLESPWHYGKPSEAKKSFVLTPQTKYNGTFVKATVPLEDESGNRAIAAWLYKEMTPIDLTEQAREITPEKYGHGLMILNHFGYKGTGPIGCNNNGLINPIKATDRSNNNTTGLGFKKVHFHLGPNKFISSPEISFEDESQAESDTREEESDDEDSYPHPFSYDLAKFFAEPDDFVPCVNTVDDTSDSSEDITKQPKDHSEKGESSHSIPILHQTIPCTIGEFFNLSPCSTDSWEYEFDSLSEVTTDQDIDQVHVYENQLEVGETSRVRSDGFDPTSVLGSSIASVSSQRYSNTLSDEAVVGLELLIQAFNDYTVNAIEPVTTLSLTHPELID
jgi:hypothetical protein